VVVRGELDLSDLTLAGESMGATVALTASLDLGDRVRRIVAFNAYDFADGVKRANLLARVVIGTSAFRCGALSSLGLRKAGPRPPTCGANPARRFSVVIDGKARQVDARVDVELGEDLT
jgi:pimeloyl-ACP methyl ester carboxylesterase